MNYFSVCSDLLNKCKIHKIGTIFLLIKKKYIKYSVTNGVTVLQKCVTKVIDNYE
jgi:hypothetical protein